MQDSLPAGGLRLCRAGVEPAGSLREVSAHVILLSRASPGAITVPPLTFRTANTVIKVARMFGEVLDPVKKYLGNISVVRGMEPKGFAEAGDARTRYQCWVPAICDTHLVEFVTPMDPNSGYLDLLERDRHVVDIEANYDSDFGGDRVRVTIRGFDPGHQYTSADGMEYPWTE